MLSGYSKHLPLLAEQTGSSHLVIALSALCLYYETCILASIPVEFSPLACFVLSGSYFIYHLACLGDSFPFMVSRKTARLIPVIIGGLLSLGCLLLLPPSTILIALTGGFLCLLYLYRFKLGGTVLQIRNIPLIKNLWLSVIWTLFTVLLPLSFYQGLAELKSETVFLLLRRFFFILAIAIPYDIRDYREDKKNSLHTLPVLLGTGKTKVIALLSLICFGFLVLCSPAGSMAAGTGMHETALAFYLSIIVTAMIIILADFSRKRYFFSLFLDGTMILQFLLVVLLLKHPEI